MAGARCATFSFLAPPSTTALGASKRRQAVCLSSISTSFPSRHRRRKNYLRPKLLETLTKLNPSSPLLPQESPFLIEDHEIVREISFDQTSPLLPQESPFLIEDHEIVREISFDQTTVVEDDDEFARQDKAESRQSLLSPTSGPREFENGEAGKFSAGSLLKLGLGLVGIFVFQTICAVWVLRSASSDQENEISDTEVKGSQLAAKERNEGKILVNVGKKDSGENIVSRDESELEEKIAEIRTMAKEARENEGKKLKNNGLNSYVEDEVDARLLRLQKKLNATRKKSPLYSVSQLNKFGKVVDRENSGHSDEAELNRTLMFKKKLKFRNSSPMPRDDQKGFQPLGNTDVSKKEKTSSSTVERTENLPVGNLQQTDSSSLEENRRRNVVDKDSYSFQNYGNSLENGKEGKKTGGTVGRFQEPTHERPLVEAVKRRSSEQVTKSSQSFTKVNQRTPRKPSAMLGKNGSSASRKVGSKPVTKRMGDKSTDVEADFWWLHLPCVMAVLMRRGSDYEEAGLYTLKIPSHKSDPIAYAVAFEDRGDAANFCYLLESFFEGLGDFRADIVPLSIKELHEGVKSGSKKVIVVKKGQIQLYAGQPLSDVEMALRSLVE